MTHGEHSRNAPKNNTANGARTTQPWLSILIPVYNVEKYLEECLQSILRQIEEGVEIVMVDDASSDGSFTLAQSFAETAPDIIGVHRNGRNEGVSSTRQTLIEKARGQYIWFIDSDDFMIPGAINNVKRVINAHAPDIVGCDYRRKYENFGWRKILLRHKVSGFHGPKKQIVRSNEKMLEGLFLSRKMYLWLKIFKRGLWTKDIRFPAGKHFEDIATTPWVTFKAKSYYHIPCALVNYRVWLGSIMGAVRKKGQPFDEKQHWEFAEAYQGFPEILHKAGIAADGPTGFAISHCIATEFVKLGKRVRKAAHLEEGGCAAARAKLRMYYEHMNASAPIPFPELLSRYRNRGIFWRYLPLKKSVNYAFGGQS